MPPQVGVFVNVGAIPTVQALFPLVSEYAWCGEFRPAVPDPEPHIEFVPGGLPGFNEEGLNSGRS
jgi:hypothetical protein